MSIEFNGPQIGPIIGNEFASVSVSFDDQGNSPRLRLEDLRTGRMRFLDALEVETLIWLPEQNLTALMDPSRDRWRGESWGQEQQ